MLPQPPLPPNVEPLVLTPEKTKFLWRMFQKFPQILPNHLRGDVKWFMQLLTDPESLWFEFQNDDAEWVGVMWCNNIVVGVDAEAHIFFWDRRLKGREEVVREMIGWVIQTLNLQRLSTYAPAYARATIRFIKRVGLVEEGVVRKAFPHNDRLYDYHLFGVLREEIEDGWRKQEQELQRSEQGTTAVSEPVSVPIPRTEGGRELGDVAGSVRGTASPVDGRDGVSIPNLDGQASVADAT